VAGGGARGGGGEEEEGRARVTRVVKAGKLGMLEVVEEEDGDAALEDEEEEGSGAKGKGKGKGAKEGGKVRRGGWVGVSGGRGVCMWVCLGVGVPIWSQRGQVAVQQWCVLLQT
jgi:hypothetical protein